MIWFIVAALVVAIVVIEVEEFLSDVEDSYREAE